MGFNLSPSLACPQHTKQKDTGKCLRNDTRKRLESLHHVRLARVTVSNVQCSCTYLLTAILHHSPFGENAASGHLQNTNRKLM